MQYKTNRHSDISQPKSPPNVYVWKCVCKQIKTLPPRIVPINQVENGSCEENWYAKIKTHLYVKRQILFGFLWYIFDLVSISNIIQMFHNMIWLCISNRCCIYMRVRAFVCVCALIIISGYQTKMNGFSICLCISLFVLSKHLFRFDMCEWRFDLWTFLITFSIKSAISRKRCSCEW